MTDLVKRLEEWAWSLLAAYKGGDLGTDEPAALMKEAADRIEALEAELNKCRKANAVMDNTVAALEAENARFRKALEFYADDYPFGNEARKALGVR